MYGKVSLSFDTLTEDKQAGTVLFTGSAIIRFRSNENGPVACVSFDLNVIFQKQLFWKTDVLYDCMNSWILLLIIVRLYSSFQAPILNTFCHRSSGLFWPIREFRLNVTVTVDRRIHQNRAFVVAQGVKIAFG